MFSRVTTTPLKNSGVINQTVTRALSTSQQSSAQQFYPSSILNVPPTNVSALDNGLRVASQEFYGDTASIGVWVNTGSRYENEKNNGTAHFLEHMAFKGTQKRTQTGLELEIENMGGHLNAYTSREQTVYHAKVFKDDLPKAMDILSDILQNSKLEESAIERERGVILRELQSVESNVHEVLMDHLHSIAFEGHSLGRTILGPESNIRSITQGDLKEYIDTYYTAPRMVLAACGPVDHDQLVKDAQSAFGGLSSDNKVAEQPTTEFTGQEIRVHDSSIPTAHVAVAVEGVGWTHPDFFSTMVLQSLVGCWDRNTGGGKNVSSKVGATIAENNLAHSLMSFNTTYQDTGLFGFTLVAEPETLEEAIFEAQMEWMRLCFDVTEAEVTRAKNQLKASMLMSLDGTTANCEEIGRQLLTYGRRISPAEIFARVDAVSVDDVKTAGRRYIYDQNPAVAAVGSVFTLPEYNRIRAWMQMWRY